MKFTNYIIGTLFLFTLTVQAQDFWQQTNGPLGGRALALAVHSNGAIFAGTGKHGLLCSKDNGEHWFRLVNGLPLPKYHFKFALTINDSGDIFAGYLNSIFHSSDGGKSWTDTNFGDYVYSLGINSKHHIFAGTLGAIYRSTDNGRRWLRVYQMSDTFFYAIAIDSNDRIFVGTYGDVPALYRSTDNGQNWIQTNLKNQPVKALLIDGNDTIFSGTAGQGVFRSEDHGQTWVQTNNGLANFPVLEIESFAYNTSGDIFVGGNIGGVYMSTDGGDHWSRILRLSSRVPALALNNESHIFVGSLSGIFRSLDSGKTWKLVGFPATKVRYLTEHEDGTIFACAEDFPVFGDIFQLEDDEMNWRSLFRGEHRIYSLAIYSNGDFFAGTSIFDHAGYGGVFRSPDRGKSWFTTGLKYNDTYSLAVNTNGDLFAGTQQGVLRLSAHVESWVKMGLIDFEVREIKVNSKDHIFARTADSAVYVSIDNGHTWSPINLPVNDAICVTIDKQDRIYIGTAAEGIFRSTDNGTNWSHIGLDSVNVNTIIVHSNGDIFAGTSDGVYVSTDNGGSWIPNNSGLSDTNIYSLLISQNGYIYAGTSGSGVFRSSIPITSIENVEVDIPLFFNLKQNYPNPFNPNTTIEFDVSHPSYLTLTIYNIKGEELETLMAKKLSAGKYKVQWQPSGLASGVYFYRLQTSDPSTGSGQRFEQTKKLLLLK